MFFWGPFPLHLFFLQKPLDDDVQHMNAFPKLGDVQVSLKIFTRCFAQKFYYRFCYFLPLLDFNTN